VSDHGCSDDTVEHGEAGVANSWMVCEPRAWWPCLSGGWVARAALTCGHLAIPSAARWELMTQARGELRRGESGEAIVIDPGCHGARPGHEPRRVDAVRRVDGVRLDAVGGAAQQPLRAHGVTLLHVRQADGELGEPTPQLAFRLRRHLPRPVQNLVRMERAPGAGKATFHLLLHLARRGRTNNPFTVRGVCETRCSLVVLATGPLEQLVNRPESSAECRPNSCQFPAAAVTNLKRSPSPLRQPVGRGTIGLCGRTLLLLCLDSGRLFTRHQPIHASTDVRANRSPGTAECRGP